ncbi:MAG: acyl-[acyl-carrier-protein] thioesterase [Lachnotalea sp.]
MYSFQTEVRYSEVGVDGKTPISSIVNYFQDCSTKQSESIGQGVDTMMKRNKGWFLTAWQIIINRYPKFGEEIIIGTWAHSFKGFYGERNFVIYDENHEILAAANTLWALVSLETGHPTKIMQEDQEGYPMEDKLDMNYLPRKIKMPDEYEGLEEFRVRKYNLDTNHHVNNAQYIQMAEEYIPDGIVIKQMRAEYKKSAVYKDIVVPKVAREDGRYVVELCNQEDTVYAIIEFVV